MSRGPRPQGRWGIRRDRGTVTAETAMLLPGLVVLVAALLGPGVAVTEKLRCADGARAGARAAARGDTESQVRQAAGRVAPSGAVVSTIRDRDVLRVHVASRVRLPLPGGPVVDVAAEAVALVEDAVVP